LHVIDLNPATDKNRGKTTTAKWVFDCYCYPISYLQ